MHRAEHLHVVVAKNYNVKRPFLEFQGLQGRNNKYVLTILNNCFALWSNI